jgi:hypothetical protein
VLPDKIRVNPKDSILVQEFCRGLVNGSHDVQLISQIVHFPGCFAMR